MMFENDAKSLESKVILKPGFTTSRIERQINEANLKGDYALSPDEIRELKEKYGPNKYKGPFRKVIECVAKKVDKLTTFAAGAAGVAAGSQVPAFMDKYNTIYETARSFGCNPGFMDMLKRTWEAYKPAIMLTDANTLWYSIGGAFGLLATYEIGKYAVKKTFGFGEKYKRQKAINKLLLQNIISKKQ